ncbi:enoyl-CoA hydratase/isomerase family protein [Mesorhizobium sp. IMUNJ 23232]|uniref:enoyl-CoA hydratase/isomerase family protein n=1 Tax=Mesorhizobium sp. IMUNJ 23232 TaxID=3376064 RepID=UPI0037AFDA2A
MNAGWQGRYETLRFERRGRVLTIVFNDPDRLNAVGSRMHHELGRVFLDAADDSESDIIVLTGAGRAFSAGGDADRIQEIAARPISFLDDVASAKRIVFSLLDLEKPVIAKVNGPAVGLGATIALFCDVTFMADTARIGDPHVSVGLVAGDGGAVIWPQLVGFSKAKEILMAGELLDATKAVSLGLVNHAVPAAKLDRTVDAYCDRLAGGATNAVRWTKVAINLELKRIAHAIMDASIAYEALSAHSAHHAEAASAFLRKRRRKSGDK